MNAPTEPTPFQVLDDDMAATVDAAPHRERFGLLFFAIIVLGIGLGFSLWVYEVVDKPAVRLEDERVSRDGLVATVQVLATNFSENHDYCVAIEIGALSRGGFDTARVDAVPTRGEGRITPGQSVNFVGVFESLTEEDYRERVDEFQAFVESSERC